MDIDYRGIRRGQCKVEGCDCDQFDRPVSATNTACAYCGDPPAKHEKLPPLLSKSEDDADTASQNMLQGNDESRPERSEGVCCLGSGEMENGSNLCRSNTNDKQTVDTHLNSHQLPETGQSISEDLHQILVTGQSVSKNLHQIPVTGQSISKDLHQIPDTGHHPISKDADIKSGQHLSDVEDSYKGISQYTYVNRSTSLLSSETQYSDSSKSASITRQAQRTEETHYKRNDPSKAASITRKAQYSEEVLYQREDPNVSTCTASTAHYTGESVLASSSKHKIDGLSDRERSELISASDKSESSEYKTLALASEERVRQISDCSESSHDSDSSDESSTDLVQPGNEIISQSGNTDFSGMKLQNIGQVTLDTGNIHIHNNTELNIAGTISQNIQSQSKLSLGIREYEDQFYVETKAYEEVESVLSGHGHVTIYGKSGDGKTAMATHLMLQYAKGKGHDKRRYESLMVHSPEEFRNTVNTNRHQIALIDDLFGVANFDQDKLMKWMPVLKDLDKEHSINRERTDGNICRIKTLLIFTSRVHIANEAGNQVDDFRFFRPMYVVRLSDLKFCLTYKERRRILGGFAKRRNKHIHEETFRKITAMEESAHGFPHCADLYTEHEYLFSQKESFFRSPLKFLRKEIEIISKTNKIQYCSLILAVLGNGAIRIDKMEELVPEILHTIGLPPHTSKSEILEGANQLIGAYFLQTFSFCHPSLLDAVTFVFGNQTKHIAFLIENCNFHFICERFRSQSYQPSNDEEFITVDESHYSFLAQRLLLEFSEGENEINEAAISFACSFQLLDDNRFLDVFFEIVSNCKGIDMFFTYENSLYLLFYSHSPIFFWAAFYGKSKFCQQILQKVKKMSEFICYFEETLTNSFIAACRFGHLNLVKNLVKQSNLNIADCRFVGSPYPKGFDFCSSTAINQAVKGGHLDVVKYLVENGGDIFEIDGGGHTLLHISTRDDNIEILKYLLQLNLDPNKGNCCFMTPLFLAKSKQAVEMLVEFGAQVEFLDMLNRNALYTCINAETVSALIEAGCDVNVRDTNMSFVASSLAGSGYINRNILTMMVDKGMDVTVHDNCGKTLLHFLSGSSAENSIILPCIEYVLKLIDPNVVDDDGCTALHCAVKNKFNNISEKSVLERVQLLKNSNVNINIVNKNSRTALFETPYVFVAEELIEAGALIKLPEITNPYEILAEQGLFSRKLVDLLYKRGFNIEKYLFSLIRHMHEIVGYLNENEMNLIDFLITTIRKFNLNLKNVQSLIQMAVMQDSVILIDELMDEQFSLAEINLLKYPLSQAKSPEVAKKLIAKGLNVNQKNTQGELLLHSLANANLLDPCIVEMLQDRKVDFNQRGFEGETVLFKVLETKKQCIDVFIALIEAGASINAQNDDGCSILHKVVSEGSMRYGTYKIADAVQGDCNEFWVLCLKTLLQHGVNELCFDKCGRLPIHVVSNDLLVLTLLENGCKTSTYLQDNNDNLIAGVLAKNGALSFEVYKRLKCLDIDFSVRDNVGASPLQYCVQYKHHSGNDLELLSSLIKESSVNSVTNDGKTVLHYLLGSKLEISEIKIRIELILKKGYKINMCDCEHNSVFHFITNKDFVTELLRDGSFNLHQISVSFQTPLLAISKNSSLSLDTLDRFMCEGEQIDALNAEGKNVLYYVLMSQQKIFDVFKIVKKLLHIGLDFVVPNKIENDLPIWQRTNIGQLIERIDYLSNLQELKGTVEQNQLKEILIMTQSFRKSHTVDLSHKTNLLFNLEPKPENEVDTQKEVICLKRVLEKDRYFEATRQADYILENQSHKREKVNLLNKCLFLKAADRFNDAFRDSCFVMGYCLQRGADINSRHDKGMTSLHVGANASVQCYLIRCGANVNIQDDDCNTPLFTAQSPEVVDWIIKKGANINHRNKKGKTALYVADDINVAKCLINNGADVNVKDNNGQTPIQCIEKAEILNYLLMEFNVDVDSCCLCQILIKMAMNDTLIIKMTKISSLTLKVLRKSLKTLNNFKYVDKNGCNELLHFAVLSRGQNSDVLPVLDFLFQNGIDPNSIDKDGDAPIHKLLHFTRNHDYKRGIVMSERLKLLLKNGANIFLPGHEQKQPIDILSDISCGKVIVNYMIDIGVVKSISLLEILLVNFTRRGLFFCALVNHLKDAHGNIYVTDEEGRTILHNFILKQSTIIFPYTFSDHEGKRDYKTIFNCLKEIGFDFEKRDKNGETALSLACLLKLHELIELLLLYGANPSHMNNTRTYLLDRAPTSEIANLLLKNRAQIKVNQLLHLGKKGFLTNEVFDTLIERKKDLRVRNRRGESLLHCQLSYPVLNKLIQRNLGVNVRTENGLTPLHCQVDYNLIQNVKLLLEAGADPNICDNIGSALEHAKDERMAEILIKYNKTAKVRKSNLWYQFENEATKTFAYLLKSNLLTFTALKLLHKRGANITLKDDKGRTAIHMCMIPYRLSEMINIVMYLLQKGLSPNARENNGKTPLHLLLEQQNPSDYASILQHLLEKGADWSLKDSSRHLPTPSHQQAPHVLCMYAEYFENASEQYINGKPLVWYFAERTKYLSLELLESSIKTHVDIDTTDTSGNTLLHIYFQNCSLVSALDVLRALKDKVDFRKQNMYGKTCLFYLSNKLDIYTRNTIEPNNLVEGDSYTNLLPGYGKPEKQLQTLQQYKGTENQLKTLLSYLFENGVDINAVDRFGKHTALYYFIVYDVCRKIPGVVELFLINGACPEFYICAPDIIKKYCEP